MGDCNLKKVVMNAAINSELESKKISDETIEMIESCLKTENGSFLFHLYLKSTNKMRDSSEVLESSKNSKYCYSNGVLVNKYGIKNLDLLHIVEGDSAAYYQSQVVGGYSDYRFGFSIYDYLKLHKKLFSAIYPFAGEIRDEFIYKTCQPYYDKKTPFCMPQFIKGCLSDILFSMKNKISTINSREELVDYLGYYYGELNMIHPFREGNGRTLRTYFLLLVKECSKYFSFGEFELDYSLWCDEDMENLIKATIVNSISGDYKEISECFDKVLVKKIVKERVRSR